MGIWLRRLGLLAVLGFPIAVLGNRLGAFHFGIAFQIIQWTVILALAVFVIGLLVSFFVRKSNPASSKAARAGALLCLLPLIGIGSQMVVGRSVPQIHNISTDITDPPQFNQVVALRGGNSNPLAYDAEVLGPVQSEAYPNVKTYVSDLTPSAAHAKALAIVGDLGWELVASDEEGGLIEATETTALWGFKDDIVIRFQPIGDQLEVDLRSVSRIGRSDLGANAKRIEKFLQAFDQ